MASPPASSRPGHRGINWDEQPLGQVSDTELAARLGVSQQTVTKVRRRRGIPKAKPQARPPRPRPVPKCHTPEPYTPEPPPRPAEGVPSVVQVERQPVSRKEPGAVRAFLARGGAIHRITAEEHLAHLNANWERLRHPQGGIAGASAKARRARRRAAQ